MKKRLFLLSVLILLSFTIHSCKDANENENTLTLVGTTWEIVGFFENGELMKMMEPEELTFHTNGYVRSYKDCIVGDYVVNYSSETIEFTHFALKCYILLPPDSDILLYIALMNTVNTFSLTKDVLKLYYNDKNDHLLFIRRL